MGSVIINSEFSVLRGMGKQFLSLLTFSEKADTSGCTAQQMRHWTGNSVSLGG